MSTLLKIAFQPPFKIVGVGASELAAGCAGWTKVGSEELLKLAGAAYDRMSMFGRWPPEISVTQKPKIELRETGEILTVLGSVWPESAVEGQTRLSGAAAGRRAMVGW